MTTWTPNTLRCRCRNRPKTFGGWGGHVSLYLRADWDDGIDPFRLNLLIVCSEFPTESNFVISFLKFQIPDISSLQVVGLKIR